MKKIMLTNLTKRTKIELIPKPKKKLQLIRRKNPRKTRGSKYV